MSAKLSFRLVSAEGIGLFLAADGPASLVRQLKFGLRQLARHEGGPKHFDLVVVEQKPPRKSWIIGGGDFLLQYREDPGRIDAYGQDWWDAAHRALDPSVPETTF